MGLISAFINVLLAEPAVRPYEDRSEYIDDEEAPAPVPSHGRCNNCGRTFHATWVNCPCPGRCGGRVYPR